MKNQNQFFNRSDVLQLVLFSNRNMQHAGLVKTEPAKEVKRVLATHVLSGLGHGFQGFLEAQSLETACHNFQNI